MNNSILQQLLIEYSKKRTFEEYEAQKRKKEIYEKSPKLQEIDSLLASLAISTTKSLLNNNDPLLLKKLEEEISKLKKEKINILTSLGLSLDYFSPKYECKHCKDTGYVFENTTSSMCNCLKQRIFDIEYNKSNIYNLRNQSFDNFSELFYSDEINEEKYHMKVSPRQNIKKILEITSKFVDNFDDPNEKNLLFTGNTGLGKTFLSTCIANSLIKNNKNVLYQTAPIMLDSVIDYRFGKSSFDKTMYDNLLNVDLLIIDDLGTECMNNMKFTELFNIINSRLLNQNKITKTIISTNLSLNNLYKTYDERIVSRIVGNYNICYFFGDDIRFKKR